MRGWSRGLVTGSVRAWSTHGDEALRCQAIVEGLLELSRPGCGSERGPVDLAELCEEVAGKVRITAGDQACAIARGGADESGELAEDWPRALEG